MKKMTALFIVVGSLGLAGCEPGNKPENPPAKTNDNQPQMTNNMTTNSTMDTNQDHTQSLTNAPSGQPYSLNERGHRNRSVLLPVSSSCAYSVNESATVLLISTS